MHKLSRSILMLSTLAIAYCLAVVAVLYSPWSWIVGFALVCATAAKRRLGDRTAFGTAVWAKEADLRKAALLDAEEGLIVGRMIDCRTLTFFDAASTLWNSRVKAADACRLYLSVFSLRRAKSSTSTMVRLPRAVHTAVFAPTGVGKDVSLVIPSLLTCPDSMVIVDFKGENARITAELLTAVSM